VLSVQRQEKKFVLTIDVAKKIAWEFEQVLKPDIHNGWDGYTIRSVYFDTIWDSDYVEKEYGLQQRRKMRMRCYTPEDPTVKLEMKQADGIYRQKRSLIIDREDAKQLLDGRFGCLLNYNEPFAAECYGVLCKGIYRPKVLIEYQRKAFVAKENSTRITLDSNIRVSESHFDLFDQHPALYPAMDPFHVIMEVKYQGFLLEYIQDIINRIQGTEVAVGKYMMSRSLSKKGGIEW